MTIEITDYANVHQKVNELGYRQPNSFAFLPTNFESVSSVVEFKQLSEAATVKTLLRNAGLPIQEIVEISHRPPYIHNNSFEWVAPTIFVTGAFLSENPTYMSLALNVISTYLTDFFRGRIREDIVKLEVVAEKTEGKSYKKISYEGPVAGLEALASEIHKVINE